jgi:hypothetical protein
MPSSNQPKLELDRLPDDQVQALVSLRRDPAFRLFLEVVLASRGQDLFNQLKAETKVRKVRELQGRIAELEWVVEVLFNLQSNSGGTL